MNENEMVMGDDVKSFIYTVTLFLQAHKSKSDRDFEIMFQRAYRLYVKYDVENR